MAGIPLNHTASPSAERRERITKSQAEAPGAEHDFETARRALKEADAANHILHLQRTIGNRAVQRILQPTNPHEQQGRFVRDARLPAGVTHIALSPDKQQPTPASRNSKFDGALLGINRARKQVRVKREVGTQGYDDRLQAIAVTRLAKADPAAVVLGTDKKWHALETTEAFEAGPVIGVGDPKDPETASVGGGLFLEVHGVPPLAGVDQARQKLDSLKKKLDELNGRQAQSDADRKALEQEKLRVNHEVVQANQDRIALMLGVTPSEVEIVTSVFRRTPGKVNIVGSPERDSPGGGHAPMGGGTDFDEGLASAFWLDLPEVDKARAPETLFHEVQHVRDWQTAQDWIQIYKKETGRLFVKSTVGRIVGGKIDPFTEWLNDQVKKKRLTGADRQLILSEIGDITAFTEARANVRSFLADLQAGATDLATKALVGYALNLKPVSEGGVGHYQNIPNNSDVATALVVEFKTAYSQMPVGMQKQYNSAVAEALKAYPASWFSVLQFAK